MRARTELGRLVQGATGAIKADLIVTGGKLINVYSGEVLDGMEIVVLDGRICYVGPSAAHARGEATKSWTRAGSMFRLVLSTDTRTSVITVDPMNIFRRISLTGRRLSWRLVMSWRRSLATQA